MYRDKELFKIAFAFKHIAAGESTKLSNKSTVKIFLESMLNQLEVANGKSESVSEEVALATAEYNDLHGLEIHRELARASMKEN